MKEKLFILCIFIALYLQTGLVFGQTVPPDGMVYVPAGSFIMGSKYGDPDERPMHIDSTKAFFIDKFKIPQKDGSYKMVKSEEDRSVAGMIRNYWMGRYYNLIDPTW